MWNSTRSKTSRIPRKPACQSDDVPSPLGAHFPLLPMAAAREQGPESVVIAPALGVLFDGFAYGMLLFLLSVGLSVTLGMMNFVNLAHGGFAMLGGYVAVTLMNGLGWPFLATLPAAFLVAGVVSVGFERTLFRRLYQASDLQQVLLTIGLAFISLTAAAWFCGTM